MRQSTEICTPITYEELTVLTEWCRLKPYYGFRGPDRELGQKEILNIMQNLCRKGAMVSDGIRFRICQPYHEMLRYLANSREVWSVEPIEKALPPICCYVGEQILLMSPSMTRAETLSMEYVDWQEFSEHLQMEGYLPEEISLPEDEWIYQKENREHLILKRITEEGSVSAELKILEFPEGFVVKISDERGDDRTVFSKRKMQEILEGYWRSAR